MSGVFNCTLIRPEGYLHSDALTDLLEYVADCLRRSGHVVVTTENSLTDEAVNVVFGAHLLTSDIAAELAEVDTVIVNSEQLADTGGWHLHVGDYSRLLQRHPVWDYSTRNLRLITNPLTSLIRLGPGPSLRTHGLSRTPGDELLFYGSLTSRRVALLEQIEAAGVPVRALFGVYGAERNAAIMSSWAVLNLHKDDTLAMYEPVRCFFPLANGVPVISEAVDDADGYSSHLPCLHLLGTDELVDGIAARYADRGGFAESSAGMLERFSALDFTTDLAAAAHLALTAQRFAS